MTYNRLMQGSTLLILPMIVASCGGSGEPVEQGLIRNSPDIALTGCTTVAADDCDPTAPGAVTSGVIIKDKNGKSIRFFTVTDMDGGVQTYSDGEDELVITDAELADLLEFGILPDGLDFYPLAWTWGLHTDATVIPVGGTATYVGTGGYHTGSHLHDEGGSQLDVNFGASTADLTLTFLAGSPIEQIEAPNMSIDGYSFTGDEVNLYRDLGEGLVLVDLTGPNSEAGSAGFFGGPIDDVLGVPSGFGAVALKEGDDDSIWISASGGATESTDIVPPE